MKSVKMLLKKFRENYDENLCTEIFLSERKWKISVEFMEGK